eukprot:1107696-Amphidinium_carterae.1
MTLLTPQLACCGSPPQHGTTRCAQATQNIGQMRTFSASLRLARDSALLPQALAKAHREKRWQGQHKSSCSSWKAHSKVATPTWLHKTPTCRVEVASASCFRIPASRARAELTSALQILMQERTTLCSMPSIVITQRSQTIAVPPAMDCRRSAANSFC